MFVPGDPTEQRKRALIAKLMGRSGKGGAGGGLRVGRPAGAGFGRGLGFGGGGGNAMGQRGQALPQMLAGYGGEGQGYGQGASEAPQFQPPNIGAQQSFAGSFRPPQPEYQGGSLGLTGPSQQHLAMNPLIQQLLQSYGQQPQPQIQMGLRRAM